MSDIYDEAWQGTLTADSLQRYLALAGPSIIDSRGGSESLTPLAAASWCGHLNVVDLLLLNRANPNALSLHDRTPLFFATNRSPAKDRGAIVRRLLNAGADVDACSAADCFYTPLMNAVCELQDKDVVHELVDHGASLTAQSEDGQTAETLAKEVGMMRDLQPAAKRNSIRGQIVDTILGVVTFIFNITSIGRLYGITSVIDPRIIEKIPKPRSLHELKTSVDIYVKESGLEKFFPPNSDFLQKLAENAAALRDDPTTDLGKPENIRRLTTLSLYQTIIYCDDSTSMSKGNRYKTQRELVARIARIATKIAPDGSGIELRFINSPSSRCLSAFEIDAAMQNVVSDGNTAIGTTLHERILRPLVHDVLESPGGYLRRPLLVCTITDGCPRPEPEDSFRDEVLKCKQRLTGKGYRPTVVMFCISQIGDDQRAERFLTKLRRDQEIQDVLYCTTDRLDSRFEELKANERGLEVWLLRLLTKPIMDRDRA